MNTNKRRILGGLFVVLAIALVAALAIANVSLLTIGSAYYADTGATRTSLHPHWPLIIPALPFLLGALLLFAPHRPSAS